eukprot:UN03806
MKEPQTFSPEVLILSHNPFLKTSQIFQCTLKFSRGVILGECYKFTV